jgi:hypothetical protein
VSCRYVCIRYSSRRVSIRKEHNLKVVSKIKPWRAHTFVHHERHASCSPSTIRNACIHTTARLITQTDASNCLHQPPNVTRAQTHSRLLSDETTSDADSARQATDKGTDRYRASRPCSSRGRYHRAAPPAPLDSVERCSHSARALDADDDTTPHPHDNSLSPPPSSAAANRSFRACPAPLLHHCPSLPPPPVAAHRRLAICPSSAQHRPSPPPSSSCLGLPPSSRRS